MKTGIGHLKYRYLTLFHVVWSVPTKVLTVTFLILSILTDHDLFGSDVEQDCLFTLTKHYKYSGIYAKYHTQIMILFVYTTTRKRFVIFTCSRFFQIKLKYHSSIKPIKLQKFLML